MHGRRRILQTAALGGALSVAFILGGALFGSSHATAAPNARTCTNATLSGNFGETLNGKSKALGLIVAVGLWRFDGKGRVTASESYNSERTGPQTRKLAGKYSVNRDCTFTPVFPSKVVKPHQALGSCVLVDAGKEFTCLDVEEGWEATIRGRKV